MAMFIEVNSVEKNCPVIINLDHVVEVAPLFNGGCELSMLHSSGMNSKTSFRVTNEYNEFMQFVMQTVSADDIAKRFPKAETLVHKTKKNGDLEIPKFGA